MNQFLNGMKNEMNYTHTENGAVTHKSTLNKVLDMFALGGAYRERSDADCVKLFFDAFNEDETLAMKCLFYLRDVRGGQGERRFFKVCLRALAHTDAEAARRNLKFIPEFGRWDDLYIFDGTVLEKDSYTILKDQFFLDLSCATPSLLGKWLKSENTSSKESRRLATKTRKFFGLSARQYRQALSALRAKINIIETLMSQNRWNEIVYDKIPSKAGLIYKNAFARHDLERYQAFLENKNTKVNAAVLNPVDIAHQIFHAYKPDVHQRLGWQKYWENLKDYYNGREENGIAVVDVSGSMTGVPMEAAVSMGAYIAERGKGPFQNHFITFSDNPALVEFTGVDIYDKFSRARHADWGGSTNIEATFDMMLNVARKNNLPASDMPQTLYIFSDMEFNMAFQDRANWSLYGSRPKLDSEKKINTLLESIAEKWKTFGYELPRVVFWNLNARNNNIPALGGRFSYISGYSMTMIEQVLSGKDGVDLMLDKLNSERYACIH